MLNGLLGEKIGMTQIFAEDGECIPVTVLRIGPCVIVQKKDVEKDGYSAVQIGYKPRKEKHTNKALKGHFQKASVDPCRYLRELRGAHSDVQVGQSIGIELFEDAKKVDVVGTSIGKGFQGVVKRHHFSGGKETHGSMFHRAPGSIGASSFPSRVIKGMRMAGHMGASRVTVKNLKVVKIDKDKNLLFVKGGVPGFDGAIVMVSKKI